MVVTKDAISFAFGWNKHGQLGSGSMKNGGFPLRFGLLMSCDITDNVEKITLCRGSGYNQEARALLGTWLVGHSQAPCWTFVQSV